LAKLEIRSKAGQINVTLTPISGGLGVVGKTEGQINSETTKPGEPGLLVKLKVRSGQINFTLTPITSS